MTLEEAWKDYEARVVPEVASFAEREFMRGAFYAGASHLWNFIGELKEKTEEETVFLCQRVGYDLEAFANNFEDERYRE